MKKLLALMVLGFVVVVVVCRQRLFLRDPLARVTRDGVRQRGLEAMINYSNDVLLLDGSGGRRRVYLVQRWNQVAAVPSAPLKCLAEVECLTDADQASAVKLEVKSR